jgi:hypothetical protein
MGLVHPDLGQSAGRYQQSETGRSQGGVEVRRKA